ncbi:conjugal transfer pilus assembly protein TraU [Glaesserella parasuis]|nr:traU family protein [Glaesserella parasuis 174]MCT8756555.1 conjugal transfer pilus assembly protein TraU [Glaesserella parasuis]MDD2170370.1 conjugal transfer pilus assembly protein TraU [Glaesserella parasuis]MDO9767934.1 conjugal transfer pilus assembly protein TraU [Glaesserella parasuis]MDO9922509.1 conjugal transfer pilus assembly protein TraU [Glaesserella parasuis]
MKKFITALILLLGSPFCLAENNSDENNNSDLTCEGRWINPISDVCWQCLFPLSIGSTKVSSSSLPDTRNPSNTIQTCTMPPPIFKRVGVAVGYWEPAAVTDVTRSPMCLVNLGGLKIGGTKKSLIGSSTSTASKARNGSFYHVHWYQYPLISWLKIMSSDMCMHSGEFDIGYMSELDPAWNDDTLSLYLNPEAMLFGNPIAQLACVADAIAAEVYLPLDILFWCAGGHGSVYPFTGSVNRENSGLNSGVLLSERMNFKLHRQGIVLDSVPDDYAVCYNYPAPIIPKERYRYQLVNPTADANNCHPYGRSVMRWQVGKETPMSSKNYGYLIWKKRNCVMF